MLQLARPASRSRSLCPDRPTLTALLLLAGALCSASGGARDFFVVSGGDGGDGNPGNGFCATAGMFAACTLRAAVEEANAFPGADRIFIGSGTIQIGSPPYEVSSEVIIEGNGALETVILGNPNAPHSIFVFTSLARATLRDVTLRGADGGTVSQGGAIFAMGEVTIERVWFDSNAAPNCGALWIGGTVAIDDSTFTNNRAATTGSGGALCVSHNGDASVTNSTFVGNAAAQGGALIVSQPSSSLELYSSTLVDNFDNDPHLASPSSAIHFAAGDLHLDKTLIVGTCRYHDVFEVSSNGGNMQSPGSSCLTGAIADIGDVTRQQLHLGSLGHYGGGLPTILPGTQSWAVDPGISAVNCPPHDARGQPRISFCDVGAVERQPSDPESGPLFYDGFESGNTLGWAAGSRSVRRAEPRYR